MLGMIVSGHGHFATGMASALELLAGKQEAFAAVDFPDGMTTKELGASFSAALDALSACDGVLVCCDIVGGSPFKEAVVAAQSHENVRVIAGTNLPLLIETALSRGEYETVDQMADAAIATGQASFVKYATMSFDDDVDDEDGI